MEGALPGELAEARILEQKRDFSKAVAERIIEPSKGRRAFPCPHYGRCGGCNAGHAEFGLQIEILRQTTIELFRRIAKIDLRSMEICSAGEWGYRHRAQVFKTGDSKIPWGFNARATNDVVPVESCPVLSRNLNERLKDSSDLKRRCIFDNQSERYLGKHIYADETVFFQSNLCLLPKLASAVKEAAGSGATLLDVFCGAGLFSALLQGEFERVIAIEENPLCQRFAEKNLGRNCEFRAQSAEKFFSQCKADLRGACAVIDPPRPGLSNDLCNALCNARIPKIIYVSCNPATLARDARKLLNEGYALEAAEGFAFYPQTFHLEMMAVFSKD